MRYYMDHLRRLLFRKDIPKKGVVVTVAREVILILIGR
jgi:hypothetical protein